MDYMSKMYDNMQIAEQLEEDQRIARAKLDILHQVVEDEKRRLDEFKESLSKEKEEYIEMVNELYKPPPPCTCATIKEPPPKSFQETMGEYTVFVSKKEEEDNADDEECLKMKWSDECAETKDPEAGQNDCMIVQLEKQLNDEMMLKMQLQSKGKPRKVCPCLVKQDGVIQPFPPSPHSHTTYFKTELTICNAKDNDFKGSYVMKRTDRIRNMHEPPTFCRGA